MDASDPGYAPVVLTPGECATLLAACSPVPLGGVLAMRPLLIHASSKARSAAPRRVLHIEYADTLDLAPGIRLATA